MDFIVTESKMKEVNWIFLPDTSTPKGHSRNVRTRHARQWIALISQHHYLLLIAILFCLHDLCNRGRLDNGSSHWIWVRIRI